MRGESGSEDHGALRELFFRELVMDIVRRQQRETNVVMLAVVPLEEVSTNDGCPLELESLCFWRSHRTTRP
jgi:hypothetical protein